MRICRISHCCPTAEPAKWDMNGHSSSASSIDAGGSFHVSCQNGINWQTDASLIPNDIMTLYPVAGSKVTRLSLVHPLINHQLCWFRYERLKILSAVLLDRECTSMRWNKMDGKGTEPILTLIQEYLANFRSSWKKTGCGCCGLPL